MTGRIPHSTRRRTSASAFRAVGLLVATVVVAAACAPLPASGPRLATDHDSPEAPPAADEQDAGGPAPWELPAEEASWYPCLENIFDEETGEPNIGMPGPEDDAASPLDDPDLDWLRELFPELAEPEGAPDAGPGVPGPGDPGAPQPGAPAPEAPEPNVHGAIFECAVLESSITEDRQGLAIDVPLGRVTTPATPDDAPPLVITAGPDMPVETTMMVLAESATDLADRNPLVIVGHRGLGDVAETCLSSESFDTLAHVADDDLDPLDPETPPELASVANDCLDDLVGEEVEYGADGAARDLTTLREAWQVPGLALLAIGEGSRTALRYATDNPDGTSLLALDSPAPFDQAQEGVIRAGLEGSEAALRSWAGSCFRPECGPGTAQEKIDAITEHVNVARSGEGEVPAAILVEVIRSALGQLPGASAENSDTLAAAGNHVLGELVTTPPGEVTPSVAPYLEPDVMMGSLYFVASCTDTHDRVPTAQIPALATELDAQSSVFGHVMARQVLDCSAWPTTSAEPIELPPELPVALLHSSADRLMGAAPGDGVAGRLTAAGTDTLSTVGWQAPGSRTVFASGCVREHLREFLDDPGATQSSVCPS